MPDPLKTLEGYGVPTDQTLALKKKIDRAITSMATSYISGIAEGCLRLHQDGHLDMEPEKAAEIFMLCIAAELMSARATVESHGAQ